MMLEYIKVNYFFNFIEFILKVDYNIIFFLCLIYILIFCSI